MDVYTTENSVYTIDLENLRYKREARPLREREPQSHRLLYEVWLPLKNIEKPVSIIPFNGAQALHIIHEDSTYGIVTSPLIDA